MMRPPPSLNMPAFQLIVFRNCTNMHWTVTALQTVMRFSLRYWVYPKNTDWWAKFVCTIWSAEKWLLNFSMTHQSFMEIILFLKPRMEQQASTYILLLLLNCEIALEHFCGQSGGKTGDV